LEWSLHRLLKNQEASREDRHAKVQSRFFITVHKFQLWKQAGAPVVDLKSLETFVCVADLASFGRAAERLRMTQPAVSQRIARLEQGLGTRLLDRDGRVIVPTAQGRQLLEYARRMIELREQMIQAVGVPSSFSGFIRVGTSETLVHTWLPDLIREANRAFPNLNLEMDVDISPRMLERLADFELDIAFMTGPVAAEDVISIPLSSYPVAFIARPHSAWRRGEVSLRDLADMPLVTFPRGSQPYQAVESLFRRDNDIPVRIHTTASLATATRMALDGTCIAAIPPIIVREQLDKGELAVIRTREKLPDLNFVAAWHSRNATHATAALINLAKKISSSATAKLAGVPDILVPA
jgi:DNA-binding transcriptional LysR family regulator